MSLPTGWVTLPLSEVVTIQRGFDLPHHARRPGPFPVLTAGETGGFHSEGPIKGPGLTIGRATNLGKPKWSDSDFWPHNTTMFVKDYKGNLPRWVFHLFENTDLSGFDSGSVQPMLNRNYIAQVPVLVPPLAEQQAIAEVLGALDDKIAANTELAATADGFIRADLLRLTENVELTTTVGALALNRKELVDPSTMDPETRYVGLEHIPRRSLWLDSSGSASSVTSTKAGFHAGDILFGKLRPYFHKVVSAPFSGVCSTDVLVLAPQESELAGFLLASVASDYVVERVTAASEGTRMPRTSWKDLSAVEIAWPGEQKAREFSASIAPVRQAIEVLLQENQTLAATRDALLPQLMSGKLRVKDAESLVSAAV